MVIIKQQRNKGLPSKQVAGENWYKLKKALQSWYVWIGVSWWNKNLQRPINKYRSVTVFEFSTSDGGAGFLYIKL